MKHLPIHSPAIVGSVLLLLVAACGSEGGAEGPAVFPVGQPLGAPSTATIGAAGGELASSDGSLRLSVPKGAVATDTLFSVQEITRTLPHGSGRAFRLGPEGQSFAAPVRLTFELGADAAGRVVAYQDDEGHFLALRNSEVDAEAGTVSVESTHFSDWTTTYEWILEPSATSVGLGESIELVVKECTYEERSSGDATDVVMVMSGCVPVEATDVLAFPHASVNGVEGGNGSVGTIGGADGHFTYTAPGAVPPGNPVALSVEVVYPGETRARYVVVANVTVVDDAAFTGNAHMDEGAIQVTAAVSWVDGQDYGGSIEYASSGTASYSLAGCSVTPSSAAIAPDDGYLVVDYTYSPPRYYGAGTTSWWATIACPDVDPYEVFVGAAWFQATTPRDASADGKTIMGSESLWSWTFTAP